MELLTTIYNNPIFQIVLKLVLITILSGIIGYERQQQSKPAGFRTHVLVGISSVLVMVCSIDLGLKYGESDFSRMPAQILSGIGFIGAGTILSNGNKVKGLTTASGLLAITCIGLMVGVGEYLYAIIATIVVFLVLEYSYKLSSNIEHRADLSFVISTDNITDTINTINELIRNQDAEILDLSVQKEEVLLKIRANITQFKKADFVTRMVANEHISQMKEVN